MSENNHARDGWYQPGAAKYFERAYITGGNFSTATRGAYVYVTGLEIIYTPDADCWAEIMCDLFLQVTRADTRVMASIDINGTGCGIGSIVLPLTTTNQTAKAIALEPLTAGVAYTIGGYVYQTDYGVACTITIDDRVDGSRLFLKVSKKP